MTDLLGLLSAIHRAVTQVGVLHLSITDVEGAAGAVDRLTHTIHISPGLSLPEMLRVLAEGVEALAPPGEVLPAPLAVGGDDPCALMPAQRHLSLVAHPSHDGLAQTGA